MKQIKDYIEQNKQRFIDELFELIRIPSISAIKEHKPDMDSAAEHWKNIILKAGADKAEVYKTQGNPIVYGEKMVDPLLPTVLVYAHYDVMPVDPVDLWKSPPFEPEIRDGRIYARGANDDKGQSFMHAKAFEYMIKTNTLPCNVKFMIEGEEEIGSTSLYDWCETYKDMLKSDVILVSDTSMISPEMPSITTGLRGLAYMEVEVTGPSYDLHSGLFGGAVANPANVLCTLISSLHDNRGRVTVKGFYDEVQEISKDERRLLGKAPFSIEEYKKGLNVNEVSGEIGYTTNERTGIRPSLDVNGIWAGYTGEGSKTVIPSKAYAKISMRLVPDQDHMEIAELFKKHFKEIAPPTVSVKVTAHHGGQPYVAPMDSAAYRAAERALTDVFGVVPAPFRSGGSIPIVSAFERILKVKTILMGFGLESDAIHSPNENFRLDNFYKGIESIPLFYKYFVEEFNKSK